jgi:hypothetical protein
LLLEDRFPVVWMPPAADEDLRALLVHRCRLVRLRTRVKNQLDGMAKNAPPHIPVPKVVIRTKIAPTIHSGFSAQRRLQPGRPPFRGSGAVGWYGGLCEFLHQAGSAVLIPFRLPVRINFSAQISSRSPDRHSRASRCPATGNRTNATMPNCTPTVVVSLPSPRDTQTCLPGPA